MLEKIKANYQILARGINLRIQEAKQIPKRIYTMTSKENQDASNQSCETIDKENIFESY